MPDINLFAPRSGRQLKEDNSLVNTAEMLEAIYLALVVHKNAGVDLQGTTINATIDTSSTMRTPVNGGKTVTSTAAELFAGASRLVGRRKMMIKNESTDIRVRVGASGVSADKGFPIEPGGVLEMDFNPVMDVPIYAASEAGNIQVEVMEV